MPIYWRYLLSHYLKVLLLCLFAFVTVLLTTRLDEIAHFATLGPEGFYVLLFTLYQIPYILPIAIPVACLISAILLIQRLSRSHELTALRAAGLSLGSILAPILLASAFLSVGSFYIVSELSTHSHLTTGLLKTQLRAVNPLLLLHNKHLMKMKGIFFQTLGPSKIGESAENVVIAMPDKHQERIHLLIAKKLRASHKKFVGNGVVLMSSFDSDPKEKHDNLLVENIGEARTTLQDFSQMMQKKVWTLNTDHLQMPLLLAKLSEEKKALAKAQAQPSQTLKPLQRCVARCYSEILRRISVGLAAFTFTLMGCSFGISISRNPSSRGIVAVIALAALYLIAFFVGRGIEDQLAGAAALFFAPHALIVVISFITLQRAARGIE